MKRSREVIIISSDSESDADPSRRRRKRARLRTPDFAAALEPNRYINLADSDISSSVSGSQYEDCGSESSDEYQPEKRLALGIAKNQLPYSSSGKLTAIPTLDEAKAIEKLALKKEYAPITAIDQIFADLVRRAPSVDQMAAALTGKHIRVATICSGTESPLLALGLISRAMQQQFGSGLEIEHVFSCEIEPFKQAYIQRNFAPPLLFRDVCELSNDEAHTAFGGLAKVPGQVDVLVAGTSCVDFSTMNKLRKGIDEAGESGDTFFGMLGWVRRHRPKVIILENVKTAPWNTIAEHVRNEGYTVAVSKYFDTRNYYIPQTRQRGYLYASLNATQKEADKWIALVKGLVRPSSSCFDDFLLEAGDPRLRALRRNFALAAASSRARCSTDWTKCKARHECVRLAERLGNARPFTQWGEDGSRSLPNGGWSEWAARQSDRVLDLLDIAYLRLAKQGIDLAHKSRAIQIAQNVDRGSVMPSRSGVCSCLTPRGDIFLTQQGRPMHGLEALSLQGIPISELDLARETSDQLFDLAGNAMTSTVVGTALLAALLLECKGLGRRTCASPVRRSENNESGWISLSALDVGTDTPAIQQTDAVDVSEVLAQAQQMTHRCACLDKSGTELQGIHECARCMQTVCKSCRGRPVHALHPKDVSKVNSHDFLTRLRKRLPMALTIAAIPRRSIEKCMKKEADNFQRTWFARIFEVLSEQSNTFRFEDIECKHAWQVRYTGDDVYLLLSLDADRARWHVYMKPHEAMSATSALRKLLAMPVLTMEVFGKELLEGQWRLNDPFHASVSCMVRLFGDKCPTWESQLGLGDTERYTKMQISVKNEVDFEFADLIAGEYQLLRDCGTPMTSLFRRIGDDVETRFLFWRSDRHTKAEADHLAISRDWRDAASTIATLPRGWRPGQGKAKLSGVKEAGPGRYDIEVKPTSYPRRLPGVLIEPALLKFERRLRTIWPIEVHDCLQPITLFTLCTTAATAVGQVGDAWQYVQSAHAISAIFRRFTSMLQDLHLAQSLQSWTVAKGVRLSCRTCVPKPPRIVWYQNGAALRAMEDEREAIKHERDVKLAPRPLLLRLRMRERGTELELSVNPLALAHAAAALLPASPVQVVGPLQLSWRIQEKGEASRYDDTEAAFVISSNKSDQEACTPNLFILELRPEQRRSLRWMMAREAVNVSPFVEEEVEESVLAQPGWRLQGRASRSVRARGGLLADAVGYGKTCITLALIATDERVTPKTKSSALLHTKATLIVVPPQLCKQWEGEVRKFCGSRLNVVVLTTSTELKGLRVADVLKADIVIVGASLLRSDAYYENLSAFSGANVLPTKSGRFFDATLEHTLRGLRKRIGSLIEGDLDDIVEAIRSRPNFVSEMYSKRDGNVAAELGKGDHRDMAKRDVWGFRSQSVRRDWRQLKSPPLEAFEWRRLVVDEFPYHADHADKRGLSAIKSFVSERRWLLSGTPPKKEFADISLIASFLGVHLGVEDDDDATQAESRQRDKQRTDTERFRKCNVIRSAAWYRRRRRVAQGFLDLFARRNKPEIASIDIRETVVPLQMCFAERALYLEIANRLMSVEAQHNRVRWGVNPQKDDAAKGLSIEGTNDRQSRWYAVVEESSSVEEALITQINLPRCVEHQSRSAGVCTSIITQRKDESQKCLMQFKQHLLKTVQQHFVVLLERHFRNDTVQTLLTFVSNTMHGDWGDEECKDAIVAVMKEIDCVPRKLTFAWGRKHKPDVKSHRKDAKADWREEEKLRDMVEYCSKLRDEFWSRKRGLRYMQAIFDVFRSSALVTCAAGPCLEASTQTDMLLIDSCGHVVCRGCMGRAPISNACCVPDCRARVMPSNTIAVADLHLMRTRRSRYGVKMAHIMRRLRGIIDEGRFVLVFVQFDHLLASFADTLKAANINAVQMQGNAATRSKILDEFQTGQSCVLLLNIADESAAGSNLTIANHIVFVSPFVACDQERYHETMEQAKGRVMRFGQASIVNIWRFVVMDTIEENIIKLRENYTPPREIAGRSGEGE